MRSTRLTTFLLACATSGLVSFSVSCGSDDEACDCGALGPAGGGGSGGTGGASSGGTGGTGGASSGGTGGTGGASSGGTGGTGGASSGGTGGASAGAGGGVGELHSGEGTFYGADGSGNCSFDPSPNDLMVAAMNDTDYAGSAVCGGCIHVTGPDGAVTVRIVDRCPECPVGDVDLSAEAFAQIADPVDGRVPIEWYDVACDVSGPIVYRFKEGSSQWWTAIQVRNTRWAVSSLEVKVDGAYVDVPRESYNYFVYAAGLGVGPYDIRVTDARGDVLEDTGIALGDGTEEAGSAQFP